MAAARATASAEALPAVLAELQADRYTSRGVTRARADPAAPPRRLADGRAARALAVRTSTRLQTGAKALT